MDYDGLGFGRRVAAAREWAGLKPKELAGRMGVSDEAVYRLERGTRLKPPRRAELRLLAEVLGQSEDWLLAGGAPPWTPSSAADGSGDSSAELLSELRALDRKIDLANLDQRLKLMEETLRRLERLLLEEAPAR